MRLNQVHRADFSAAIDNIVERGICRCRDPLPDVARPGNRVLFFYYKPSFLPYVLQLAQQIPFRVRALSKFKEWDLTRSNWRNAPNSSGIMLFREEPIMAVLEFVGVDEYCTREFVGLL